jgi:minor extracellular serine protease Vpr
MKKFGTLLMLIAIITVAVPTFAQGGVQPVEPQVAPAVVYGGDFVDETPDTWFVQLASAPGVDGTAPGLLKKEKDDFRNAASKAGLSFTERYAFDTLWNGLSIKINPADLGKLARIPGVKALYPVVAVSLPEPTGGEELDLFTSLAMIGADVAQSELGYTGAGIKVAVMDTGIDYDHPDLGGCFGPGCRVAYGYDLVGDAFSAGVNDERTPDPDPDDCYGHGTHVAGIIGANGAVTGVAPEVTFGSYRVFGCEGSTWSDIMIEAMEMIHHDHMDVLNMSIGSAFQWPQYPTAVAADKLVERGTVVVASIGNEGTYGAYAVGAPGVGEKVIGVASFDNSHVFLPYFTVNDEPIGYITMTFSPPPPTSGTYEIVDVGLACSALPVDLDLTGKVALAARGTCSFAIKATNAINAGAAAVVISNNAPGVFNGTLGAPIDGVTPVVGISLEGGNFIRAQLAPVMMTWTDQEASFLSPTGGLISSFSSYGLAPDLSLKPDIGAPGGNIYSTYPLEKGGYATMGGTSMASPHVAGAAALLLQAKPGTKPLEVRDILQNSADPKLWSLAPSYGLLDLVHRQGAGMLDIDDAVLATTMVTPAKLALGESEAGPYQVKLTVANNGPADVTYDLGYESAIATTGTWAADLDYWLTDEVVQFQPATLSLKAGQQRDVRVTLTPPTGPDLATYGGYIVLTPREGGQVYRVPYAGFVGDYQALPVLDANPFGLPWLLESADGDFVYTMADGDYPELWVNLGHQVELLTIEAFDAATAKSLFWVDQAEYVGRNSASNSIFSWVWDGTTTPGKEGKKLFTAPDGDYVLVLKVLKALGDKTNPEHWETWTSPLFVIDRP